MSFNISTPSSKFRIPHNNSRLTKGLFWELVGADKTGVLYTLKDQDHEGYPSLYRLYMETDDPTEWDFAQKYMDGWEHWEMVSGSSWFQEHITRWRKELDLRMRSRALARIKAESKTGSKEALAASRYLLEKGWIPKDERTRGRPSKDEIKRRAEEEFKQLTKIDDDLERIRGKVN